MSDMKKYFLLLVLLPLFNYSYGQVKAAFNIGNDLMEIFWNNEPNSLWTYHLKAGGQQLKIKPPVFEIDGKKMTAILENIQAKPVVKLSNGVSEYAFEGKFKADTTIHLITTFRLAKDNCVVRF